MKKRMTAILLTASCIVSGSAWAAGIPTVQPINFTDDTVVISGSIEEQKGNVRIVVVNPGVDLGSVTSGEDMIKYQSETSADESGKYSFKFTMLSGANIETGTYNVYVMNDSLAAPLNTSFYYEKKEGRDSKITEINTKDATYLKEHMQEYIKAFGLDQFEALNGADTEDIANALKNEAEFADGDYIGIQECMKESAILSCYENGQTQYLYDNTLNIKNADLIGFDTMDTDYSCTFYKIYNEILNNHGKKLVLDSLVNKGYESYDVLKKAFMKSVMLYSIANTDLMGAAHVSEIITANNAAAVFMNATSYLNYSNKNLLNSRLVEIGSFADIPALESAISTVITNMNTQNQNGSSGNNGGSSSGNNSGILITAVPQDEPAAAASSVFTDVDPSFWGVEAIEALYDENIISGFGDGSFRPHSSITREQAVKMLCGSAKIDTAEYSGEFADVKSGDWFAPYIAAAVKEGFIKGREDHTFGVGENITREDFAVMLYRIIGTEEELDGLTFIDKDSVSAYALEAVSYMHKHKFISGYEDGSFQPKKALTRAEAAAIIYRYLKR